MKLKALADKFIEELQGLYEQDEITALFLIVIKHTLGYSKTDSICKKEDDVTVEQVDVNLLVLQELKFGKPLQYILGETEFYGLTLKVNEAVLIPRPETEELVEWIIEEVTSRELRITNNAIVNRKSAIKNILDIGTGSGCIAIALKKKLQNAEVYALDIAEDSLEVAQHNAAANQAEVTFLLKDILETSYHPLQKFDVIVSNPPYITNAEKLEMHQNVLAHEPHRALFVSNDKPLIFYEAISDFALINLKKGGQLYFEINEYLAKQIVSLLKLKGFNNITLKKDMQGKDRMIKANL